jgi:predicted phage replisome organizer
MADVKWIKICTDIFDDEKILMIESLPSADTIIVIWFKLLTFAGKQNSDGVFLMNNRIAYTDEMLATIFRRDINVVRLALRTFEDFGMIEIIDGVVAIPNWNKHQTLDAYEKKKERDRIYQQERRAKQRLLIGKSSDTSPDCQKTQSSDVVVSEEDKDKEKEIDKDIDNISDSDESKTPASPKKPKKPKKEKPPKNNYGEFQHVLLTHEEIVKLEEAFGVEMTDKAVQFLDEYIEEKGYKSQSHYLAIRRWVIDAVKEKEAKKQQKQYSTKEEAIQNRVSVVDSW